MPEEFRVNIAPGISIITLGSIGILVANFIKSFDPTADVSLFNLSAFCLILSGIIIIYILTVLRRTSMHLKKRTIAENKGYIQYFTVRNFTRLIGTIGNTLFDVGIILLLFGVGRELINELKETSIVRNYIFFIAAIAVVFFITNSFSKRYFEE